MRRLLAATAGVSLLIACSSAPDEPAATSTSLATATVRAAAPPTATAALPAEMPAPTASPLPAGVAQATIPAARDTTIFESEMELANGAGDALFVGRNRGGRAARALLYFDVASTVPEGAVILEARLVMRSSRAATGDAIVTLHPALAAWGEGASSANRGEGTGAPAQPGDATWSYRVFPDGPWVSPGGDFGPPVEEAHFGQEVASYTWGPNAGMTEQVQAWLDDPTSNWGWLLRTDEDPQRVTAIRFHSREGGADRSGPRLIVTYAAP